MGNAHASCIELKINNDYILKHSVWKTNLISHFSHLGYIKKRTIWKCIHRDSKSVSGD